MVTVKTDRGNFELSEYQVKSIISQLVYNPPGNIFFFIPNNPEPVEEYEIQFMRDVGEFEKSKAKQWPSIIPYGIS